MPCSNTAKKYGVISETLRVTLKLLDAGHSPERVAQLRGVTPSTVADQILALVAHGASVDLAPFLDSTRIEQVRSASADWKPGEKLAPIRQRLHGQWSWVEVKICLAQVAMERGGRRLTGLRERCDGPRAARPRVQDSPWYSRGYTPRCDRSDRPQFITYRLADSLPRDVAQRIRDESEEDDEVYARMQQYLDAGYGACWLKRPEFAEVVEENLHFHDGKRYRLLDWVIMPNHVHVAYDRPQVDMETIVHGWKSYTGHVLKKMAKLGKEESFWQRGVFDRFIRDERHLSNVECYIYLNAVKAGLVTDPFDWPWSSIHKHAEMRPKLRSWWRANSEKFWKAVER